MTTDDAVSDLFDAFPALGREASRRALYEDQLGDIEYAALQAAVAAIIRAAPGEFPPSIADVRAKALDMMLLATDGATYEGVWCLVVADMSRHFPGGPFEWNPAIPEWARRVVLAIGGLGNLKELPHGIARKQFLGEAMRRRGELLMAWDGRAVTGRALEHVSPSGRIGGIPNQQRIDAGPGTQPRPRPQETTT